MRIRIVIFLFLIATLNRANPCSAADEVNDKADGQSLTFDSQKGNCLACHAIPNELKAVYPGNIGAPLVMMKKRYPDRAKLRAQIWDATVSNPDSSMPPFGRNKVLTEQEIDQVTDYIQGL